ncbi:hypothetical protein AG0111_0g12964 [Alternaria gaisen]|uniref:Uncharacterized protein n=1 Tax=Alternaria gaisen TaxID=167740 RepID=A0ACB6F351_9PLEO|nr:hypothetical protein AG0111_0g12964 [Alternaria gaisen]
MLSTMRTVLHAGLILQLSCRIAAQPFQIVGTPDRGYCSFDFDNPTGYFAYNGIDGGDTQIGSGGTDPFHSFLVICNFQFIGQADRVTQTAAYRNTAIVPTIVVPFTDVPVTSLVPGSNAQCTAVAGTTSNALFQIQETYVLNSQTSVAPSTSSTVVVFPMSVLTTTTTTTTLIQQTETTVTPDTVTSTVVTGTKTVLGKPTLTTKTVSITPWARTVKRVSITYTTTTLSCIPPPKVGRSSPRQEGRAEVAARAVLARQDNTDIETATCFNPTSSTPTIINTYIFTSTTTSTIVEQALTTTTTISTVTAPAPTAIQNVQATSTLVPTFTRYRWTVLPRTTVTSTISLVNTVTKLPKTPLKPCVRPTPTPPPGSGSGIPQCQNTTTIVGNGCQKVQCKK